MQEVDQPTEPEEISADIERNRIPEELLDPLVRASLAGDLEADQPFECPAHAGGVIEAVAEEEGELAVEEPRGSAGVAVGSGAGLPPRAGRPRALATASSRAWMEIGLARTPSR
jgi:hypothetical protein